MEDKKDDIKQDTDESEKIEIDTSEEYEEDSKLELSEENEISEDVSHEEFIRDLEDQLLRAKAEVQNVRRIAAQEVTKARLFGVESFAKEILSVSDNLERAIKSSVEEEVNPVIKEGLELTLKSLEVALKSSGIEAIDTKDHGFDPEKHEAISLLEDDSLEPNTIIDTVQKGYTIMDRTLRPAKVVVSKKSKEK